MLYIHCQSCCNVFFSCPYMVTVVLSITLAAEDVTALVGVHRQFKKIHQIIGYNKMFHFISLIFWWITVADVGGSGPCDCMCMHCGQSCTAFLLTLQFTLSVKQKFHHGGITGNAFVPQQNHLCLYCLLACRFVSLHTMVWCNIRNNDQLS